MGNKPSFIQTVRRWDAECLVDLSKRRRWYETPPPTPPHGDGEGGTGTGGGGQGDPGWFAGLPKEAQDEYRRLQRELTFANSESMARKNELKKRDEDIEAMRKGQQKQLEEQGQYKTLAEQRAAEIAELAAFKTRAEALEKMIRESNTERVKKIPETLRELVPGDYSPEMLAAWLDKNWERLTKAPAPNIDAGAGGSGGNGTALPKLTDQERELTRAFGMTEKEYAEQKAMKGQPMSLDQLGKESRQNG